MTCWRRLFIAVLCALSFSCSSRIAEAQGVTRVCQQAIGANGSNNCVDVGSTQPLNVTPVFNQPNCNGVININQSSSSDVHTFVNTGNICSIVLATTGAQNIGVDEGTGTFCETGGTALIGTVSTSAATPGFPLTTTTQLSATAGSPWLHLQKAGDHLCVLQSGGSLVSGVITYVDK
jgi:hypothetical protein